MEEGEEIGEWQMKDFFLWGLGHSGGRTRL